MNLPSDALEQARRQFGDRVRELREAAGLTQEELAHLAGVSRKTVGRIEVGEGSPLLSHVFEIAYALGTPTAELFPSET